MIIYILIYIYIHTPIKAGDSHPKMSKRFGQTNSLQDLRQDFFSVDFWVQN